MNVEELAEELADFWASALVERDWAGRLELMNRIHEQLYKDLEDERTFRQVSLHFVAAAIHRLGDPPVTSDAQAEIYAQSADEAHCQAARLWWKHGRGGNEAGAAGARKGGGIHARWWMSRAWCGSGSTRWPAVWWTCPPAAPA